MPRTIAALFALVLLAAAPLSAQGTRTVEIPDRQGFEAPMVAYRLQVPTDWSATGEILWVKPCSGNEFYEFVLNVTSPDGLTGLRLMPGHQVVWTDVFPVASMPGLAEMTRPQLEADRNRMRTAFQGSNCHVGQIDGGTEQLLRALVLGDRPAGTRVTAMTKNTQVLDAYRQIFTGDLPGTRTFFDAVEVTLSYPAGQRTIDETMWFSWYLFQTDPTEMSAGLFSQQAVVDPIRLIWRPADRRAADDQVLTAIAASLRVDPDWQRRTTEFQRRILAQRRQQRQDAADQRNFDRFVDGIIDDIRHWEFIDMIRQ